MSTKNRIFPFSILALLFMTTSVYASTAGWWLGGGLYTMYPQRPSSNSVFMGGTQPPVPDYYYVNAVGSATNFEANLFYQFCQPWSYRVGVIYINSIMAKISGNIQNSDQIDYNYSYKIQSRVFFFDLQIDLLPPRYFLSPYIDLGAGPARLFFSSYTEGTYPGSVPRLSPSWNNHAQNKFAYRYGLGLNYEFSVYDSPVAISLALLYINLGKAYSGYSNTYPAIAGTTLASQISGKTAELTIRFNLG